MWSNWNIHTASGNVKWYTTLKIIYQQLIKLNHTLTTKPSNSTPRYLPKRIENIWSYRDLYTNVHNMLFIIAKILEITLMASTDEWISK